MNIEQAEALIKRQAQAWERADIDACVADFAEDALYLSPGGRWQGPAAIRAVVEAFFAGAGEVKVTISRVLVHGNYGAVEWTWQEKRHSDQQVHRVDDGIIFEVRDDKIVYWHEYFDTARFDQANALSLMP